MKFDLEPTKKDLKDIKVIRRRLKYVLGFMLSMIIVLTMLFTVFHFFIYLFNKLFNLNIHL
jgi:hypothetical protein